jgi:predicted NAD-dependent protein-ADP-ribosyltransferase YbiA (DUF1768 family)
MSVTIRNSLDKPFGKLANDAILPFKVNSRKYSSVVNYVYANLLPESTFKEELAQTLPKNVLGTFGEVRNHLKKSTIRSASHLAVTEKARQNPEFIKKLMETDNRKILYYSPNNFMGIGKDKTGENIYGQCLEQTRTELLVEHSKAKENEIVYLTYIAEINLKKAFRKHDLEKYISKDKKRSIKRLVDALVHDYGKTEVFSNAPDLDTILTMHEKRNIINYTDPNSLIRIIRKNEVKNVLRKNLSDLKLTALQSFVDYAISKNVTLSEDKTALKDQFFDILPTKRDEFTNRILDLYSAKALPEEVKEKIKKYKSQWYFPTEKDIEYFERENIKLPELTTESTLEVDSYKVYVENDILSPLDESSVIVINNLEFKTISHYIAFELNKLSGQTDPNRMYIRIKDVRVADLDRFNKTIEKDVFSTTKDKLLEEAINIKIQEYQIKNLIFSLDNIDIEDNFDLEKTTEIFNKYKDKIILKIHQIPSFEKFVEKDSFLVEIIKDKVDFYFMILDNLMVHTKAKHRLSVSYDQLVEMSPFYSYIMINDSDVPKAKIPDYLFEKNKQYGLTNQSLLQIWTIVYNGLKQSEKIVGKNNYDIRYKSLFVWAKYFMGQSTNNYDTFEVMQSRQEDQVLMAIFSILSKLKEVNIKVNSPSVNDQDLQTAIHLCLGKVRVYKHEYERVEDELEFEEEVEEQPYEEVYDYDEFEGFNLSSRKRFEAMVSTYFNPLKSELDLNKMEESVYKVLNSKIPLSNKLQNLNFFLSGFTAPSLE